MNNHYVYLVTDRACKSIEKAGQVPEELCHKYFEDVRENDNVWLVSVTEDFEDALILGRFCVASITRLANGVTTLKRTADRSALVHASLADAELRLESENVKAVSAGVKCCKYGVELGIDMGSLHYDRGFRTGVKLTQASGELLEKHVGGAI
jgi:hypothetical protein